MLSGNPSTARNRYPFTATQWQELEHQALIFKYMASGVPIPTDLVYSSKRRLDSSISSRLFPHHPIGWGCYELGFGRKIDPEPGRCRRTDGKKWRCSKEAYPDSKYCERHMHRGKNRSRKPVEVSSSSTATTPPPTAAAAATADYPSFSTSSAINKNLNKTSPSVSSYSLSPLSSSLSNETQAHQSNSLLFPFLNYPQSSSSSSRPPQLFSTQNNTTATPTPQLFLNSGSYNNQSDNDFRYLHGAKEGVDELAFFPESSANGRSLLTGGSSSCQPLMSSYRGYSQQSQYQSLTDHHNNPGVSQQSREQQHCFVWGTDFKSSRVEKDVASESQKSLHHFFGDWQPQKSADTWLDLASNSSGVANDG